MDQFIGAVEPNGFAGAQQALNILSALLRLSRHRDDARHVEKKLRDTTHLPKAQMGAFFRRVSLPLDTGPIARDTVRCWGSLYGVEPEELKAWLEDRSKPASKEHVRNWHLRERLKKVVSR